VGLPTGFRRLIAAQFTSALADNALLIVTIALLAARGLPPWWAPLLKVGFTLSYVALAPFVGPLADAFPKARLMAWMNGVKVLGVIGLLAGLHPVAAFTVVGLGAAAYAPAKYGLVCELVAPRQLVAANGWVEVSVVCAALLGAVLGGVLVSPAWLDSTWADSIQRGMTDLGPALLAAPAWAHPLGDDSGALGGSLIALLGLYALAGLLNLGIPDSGARYAAPRRHPVALVREFRLANRTLWRDRDGGLSLAVTTLFWGVGATLQFAVLRWADEALNLPLDQAARLQAAVAIGVIGGATAAGRFVSLAQARRMLPAGIALGLLMPVVASTANLPMAAGLLVAVGAVGGLLVVPLNALLQHRGHSLLSAGRSIAVQGYNENASVLAMLALYAALTAIDVPIVPLMWGFGLVIATAMAGLMRRC